MQLFLLLLVLYGSISGENQSKEDKIHSYYCSKASVCSFKNLNLTDDHTLIIPTDAYKGTRMVYESSKIYTLTSNICDHLFNLTEFILKNLGLYEIKENAFKNCSKLKEIDLWNNNLNYLHPKLFDNNFALLYLDLGRNYLTEVQYDWFLNKNKLKMVNLIQNYIAKLDMEKMPHLPNLTDFYLSQNELQDFDAEMIVKKLLNLKNITLNHNHILCSRYKDIKNTLGKKLVTFGTEFYRRKYVFKQIDKEGCITEENSAYLKVMEMSKQNKIVNEKKLYWEYFIIPFGIIQIICIGAFTYYLWKDSKTYI